MEAAVAGDRVARVRSRRDARLPGDDRPRRSDARRCSRPTTPSGTRLRIRTHTSTRCRAPRTPCTPRRRSTSTCHTSRHSSRRHDLGDGEHHEVSVRPRHCGEHRRVDDVEPIDAAAPGSPRRPPRRRRRPSGPCRRCAARHSRPATAHVASSSSRASTAGSASPNRSIGAAVVIACTSSGRRELDDAAHAVDHAHPIALVADHVLVDERVDGRIGRREAERALREALVDPHADEPDRARSVCGSSRRSSCRCGPLPRAPTSSARTRWCGDRTASPAAPRRAVAGPRRRRGGPAGARPTGRSTIEPRPDARAQEDRRRVHRARAEHDLAGLDRRPLAVEAHAHADRSTAIEEHSIDEGVADDPQVRTVARRLEVRVVRRDPLLADRIAVDRVGRHALTSRRVVVGAPAVAGAERRIAQRSIDRAPPLLRDAEDRHRPVDAVPRIAAEVVLGLEPAVRGQHVIPPPAGMPHSS